MFYSCMYTSLNAPNIYQDLIYKAKKLHFCLTQIVSPVRAKKLNF